MVFGTCGGFCGARGYQCVTGWKLAPDCAANDSCCTPVNNNPSYEIGCDLYPCATGACPREDILINGQEYPDFGNPDRVDAKALCECSSEELTNGIQFFLFQAKH